MNKIFFSSSNTDHQQRPNIGRKKVYIALLSLFIAPICLTLAANASPDGDDRYPQDGQTLNHSSIFPARIGTYSRLRMVPRTGTSDIACSSQSEGLFIYDGSSGEVKICKDGSWSGLSGGFWAKDGDLIYPAATASNTALNVGIGTSVPVGKLHVYDDAVGERGSFKFFGEDGHIEYDGGTDSIMLISNYGDADHQSMLTWFDGATDHPRLTLKNSGVAGPPPLGFVGVGRSDPAVALDIGLGADLTLESDVDNPYLTLLAGNSQTWQFYVNNTLDTTFKIRWRQASSAYLHGFVAFEDESVRIFDGTFLSGNQSNSKYAGADTAFRRGQFEVHSANDAVSSHITVAMVDSLTPDYLPAINVLNRTSQTAQAGLGARVVFEIDDPDGADFTAMAGISGVRGSNDTTGHIRLEVNKSGSLDRAVTLFPDQSVAIGRTSTDGHMLALEGTAGKTSGGSDWASPSDRRFKTSIRPLSGALENITRLKGLTYEWISPNQQKDTKGPHIGFIAQDVEDVFPNWVYENTEGWKYLSISGFPALTVEAFREIKAMIERENLSYLEDLRELKTLLEANRRKIQALKEGAGHE